MLDIDCGQATDRLKANPKYQLEIGSHTNISICLSGLRYKVSPRFVVNFGRSSEPSMLAFFLGGPSTWEFWKMKIMMDNNLKIIYLEMVFMWRENI